MALSLLTNLTRDQYLDVYSDIKDESNGAIIHYIIDPYEIQDFCFPLGFKDIRKESINFISDEQVAFYYLFFQKAERPILLNEYFVEIHNFSNVIKLFIRKNLIVEREFKTSKEYQQLMMDTDNINVKDEAKIIALLERSLTFIFSIALSESGDGLKRYEKIIQKRLMINSAKDEFQEDNDELQKIYINNRYPEDLNIVYEKFKQLLANQFIEFQRTRFNDLMIESLYRDATVVSRVIDINKSSEKAFNQGVLKRRHIFLYLSSARRSKQLFLNPEIKCLFPLINGKQISFHRTRSQIFANIVLRNLGDDDLKRFIESKKNDNTIFENLNENKEVLGYVDKYIDELRNNFGNLAMLTQLSDYRTILNKVVTENKLGKATELFNNILKNLNIQSAANELYLLKLEIITTENFFRFNLFEVLQYIKDKVITFYPVKGKDTVASSINSLPMIFRLKNKHYRELINEIVTFILKSGNILFRRNDLHKIIIETCHKLVKQIPTDKFQMESELVKNYLLMLFTYIIPDIDEVVFENVKSLINKIRLLNEGIIKVEDAENLIQDLYYIAVWAGRRSCNFDEAYKLADVQTKLFSNKVEPRFYQGKCLIIYSWLREKESNKDLMIPEEINVTNAIENAKLAIEGFLIEREKPINNEIIASLYNSIAYFYAYFYMNESNKGRWHDYLDEARINIDLLKSFKPKDKWNEGYCEYFHTESVIELKELELLIENNESTDQLFLKANDAYRDAKKAYELAINLRKDDHVYRTHFDFIVSRHGKYIMQM